MIAIRRSVYLMQSNKVCRKPLKCQFQQTTCNMQSKSFLISPFNSVLFAILYNNQQQAVSSEKQQAVTSEKFFSRSQSFNNSNNDIVTIEQREC